MTKRFVYLVLFVLCLTSLPALLTAQGPHGGAGTKLQPGPNVNAAGGIVNPGDPAALIKSDILLQRQNETVVAASTRNPDHLMAAANDYRFVDFPDDPQFGGAQNFIARLIARLLGRPTGKRLPPSAAAANVGPWTGVYRSCDRGRTWIGSALPGSPLDNSPAAQLPDNPLKQLSVDAAALGGHAETTDPVLKAGPGGRMHMVVLGFVRFPLDNSVGASRMFYASYTDRNNVEGGSCFNFDFIRQIDTSTVYAGAGSPNPFIDKPSIAVDKDGMIVVSYTLFTDAVKSKIVIARSVDGGATWTKTMPVLSLGFLRNHGTSTTIDPVNGTVYVAWRLFYQDWPLMVVSRSFDRGKTFLPATPISHWWPTLNIDQIVAQLKAARLRPFDQFNETPGGDPSKSTARSLAFPSIVAGAVNGKPRLYAVWQERAQVDPTPAQGTPAFGLPYSNGSPRVMFTMSSDGGWSWTSRRAIDAGARVEHPLLPGFAEPPETRPSGPQVQPMLSISGLNNPQLLVLYYEARDELAAPNGSNFISGIERQMDVRAARINPVTGQLVAPSVQVAQYAVKANSLPVALAETAPGYDAVSRPNLWMYGGGTKAFFGDYPFIVPSVEFEFDTGSRWKWASEPASALAIWTDHRDVQFPTNGIGGAWNNYTPVTNALASCSHVALRNANPYFTEIAGVVAGSPQNFKPLNIQRSFVTYVENRTMQDRRFRLTLSGSPASFDQFASSLAINIQVFANSSRTQTIWVAPNPSAPTASVRMAVVEIGANGGVVAGGYRTSVTLNPDPNNDALTPIPSPVPVPGGDPTINSSELHNPQVSAPQVSAFNIRAPQVSAPQVSAPQVSAPQVSAPQVSAPQVSAPQVSAPQVSAATPGDGNEGTDVTYTVTNVGNTESTYNALLNVPGVQGMLAGGFYDFQVLITRTSLVPGFLPTAGGCLPAAENRVQVIANLQIPDASAAQFLAISGASSELATFSVAPAGGADVAAISTDNQSTIPRDEVKVTLRAIRLQPLANIPAEFVFEPAEVVLTVAAESTNVLNGVVQPDGTQPVATATTTTLALATSPLGAQGDAVTLIATVSPAPPNAAQTMVQFFNGDTFLGAAPTDDGEASLTLQNLPFAIRSFTARFTGSPTLSPSTSGVIAQHVVQRLGDVEAFDAAVAGLSIATQDFNAFPAGTPISQLNPIGGMLNFTSSFETLQVWTDNTAFGLNGGTRQNGRYDLFFLQPGAALAFDIAAQDPATSPAAIEVVTSAGSVFFTAVNPGVETANVFHGFIGTLPILGVRVYEGCETGQPVVPGCLNEEITIDNVRIVGRDVRLWSVNGHYYEYVRHDGLSWTEANAAAQARSHLGQPGRLVSITSAAENAFVDSLRDEGPLRAWIGLRDSDGIGAGSWAWTTGEPTSYFNWAPLEPNNPSTEFWVEIFAGGAWNNNTVRDLAFPTLGYIVEYDPPAGEIGFMTAPFKESANGSQH
jgi:Bacterial Ig-like domain (group 3)/Lectin C-type domain